LYAPKHDNIDNFTGEKPVIWILAAFGNPFAIALAAFREIGRIVKWILIEAV
jgi:hypothetical protein